MNVTETNEEGLRRELKVVIGADELERRLSARLDELKDRVKLKGFRPGHVPEGASAEGVWPLGDGRRGAAGRRRDEPAGDLGAAGASGLPADHRAARG